MSDKTFLTTGESTEDQDQKHHPTLYWLAEVLDATANLVCTLTAHFRGCCVNQTFINTRLGRWAFDTLSRNRYPEYRGACDGCALCGRKYKQTVPNPYFASERELAEWARWYGSDVSPADYAEWCGENGHQNGTPYTYGGQTYQWTYCANCKTLHQSDVPFTA